MIPCNGCYSGERAVHAKRTRAGETDAFAERGTDCCDVFVSCAAKLMRRLRPGCVRSLSSIPTGSHLDEPCKTSPFTERLRHSAE